METPHQHQHNNNITTYHHDDHHRQEIPMCSGLIWPHNNNNYHHNHHLQIPPPPSSSLSSLSGVIAAPSSSSSFFNEIIGAVQFGEDEEEEEEEAEAGEEEELGAMKEMMYKIAAMQPVDIDPATIRKPKRRNVRISDDPQSVAARHRRERISERIRILQRLVPGGTKMDTASMLDEAIRYVKFLKRQIRLLQSSTPSQHHPHPLITQSPPNNNCIGTISPAGLATTGGDNWPFAPNLINGSPVASVAPTASMDMPAGMGFSTMSHGHGHATDASSTFNLHKVISDDLVD